MTNPMTLDEFINQYIDMDELRTLYSDAVSQGVSREFAINNVAEAAALEMTVAEVQEVVYTRLDEFRADLGNIIDDDAGSN